MNSRPLGIVADLAKAVGFGITHAWDDLAFGEHSVFILQFGEADKPLKLFFNRDLEQPKRQELEQHFLAQADHFGVPLAIAGSFALAQKEASEELELSFFVSTTKSN